MESSHEMDCSSPRMVPSFRSPTTHLKVFTCCPSLQYECIPYSIKAMIFWLTSWSFQHISLLRVKILLGVSFLFQGAGKGLEPEGMFVIMSITCGGKALSKWISFATFPKLRLWICLISSGRQFHRQIPLPEMLCPQFLHTSPWAW